MKEVLIAVVRRWICPKNKKRTTHLFETSTLAPDFSLVGVWKFIINKKGENMKFFEINNIGRFIQEREVVKQMKRVRNKLVAT